MNLRKDGRSIEVQKVFVYSVYTGDSEWKNVILPDLLMGQNCQDGKTVRDGRNGINAKTVKRQGW